MNFPDWPPVTRKTPYAVRHDTHPTLMPKASNNRQALTISPPHLKIALLLHASDLLSLDGRAYHPCNATR